MLAGFIVVAYLSGLDSGLAASIIGGTGLPRPDWMPVIEFPWRIMFGTIVTFGVAVWLRKERGTGVPPVALNRFTQSPYIQCHGRDARAPFSGFRRVFFGR